MNLAKQKLLLEHLVSSKDLFARTAAILKPSYFDIEYKRAMALIHAYYQMYSSLPSIEVIQAECDVELSRRDLNHNEFVYWCDECENFAKRSAMKAAIQASVVDMNEGNYDKIYEDVSNALKISLDRDLGVDLYADPSKSLAECLESLDYIPTGIKIIDENLGGGIVRQQTMLFSANSGGGKSIIMNNVAVNLAETENLHVLILSLELPQNMIITRLAAISTGEDIKTWRTNTTKIAAKLIEKKERGVGSVQIKRMPNGASANDMRAYLKQYEMQFERFPDIIVVDYLDLMNPNGGTKGLSISEQDRLKSEQLYEIGIECNAAIITASQQNRSGITNPSADQTVIAGGFSKINIVDNYISLKMDDTMRLEGIMIAKFLKTRSSDAVGKSVPLKFNSNNLRITDVDDPNRVAQLLKRWDSNNKSEGKSFTKDKESVTIKGRVAGLSPEEPQVNDPKQDLISQFVQEI